MQMSSHEISLQVNYCFILDFDEIINYRAKALDQGTWGDYWKWKYKSKSIQTAMKAPHINMAVQFNVVFVWQSKSSRKTQFLKLYSAK